LSSFLPCSLEEFPEAVESAFEHPSVSRDPRGLFLEPARAEPASAYPSDFFSTHQPGCFEYSDVFLDARQGDVEGLGELAYSGVRATQTLKNSAAGRVGEGGEGAIELP